MASDLSQGIAHLQNSRAWGMDTALFAMASVSTAIGPTSRNLASTSNSGCDPVWRRTSAVALPARAGATSGLLGPPIIRSLEYSHLRPAPRRDTATALTSPNTPSAPATVDNSSTNGSVLASPRYR